uniref:Translation initiation factor IF-2 n=1 Tax=Anthurium amnicola TaxID=1678845 RepID=A0A1D1Y156_9ARAE
MNRVTRDSLAGGRSVPAGSSLLLQQQQRRIRSLAAGWGGKGEGRDEGLDLFSQSRRSTSIAVGEESGGQNVPVNLGRISVGSAKLMRSGIDDLLSAADMGKHDYDWLLTPPGTPLVSTLDHMEAQLPSVAQKTNHSARSATTKTSRFSVSQPENKHPTRPARSSSATRPSIATYSTSQMSSNSSRTSILNTSTASITSSRPSTPGNPRSTSSSSTARQSAPASSRPTPSRSSTPSKTRPAPSSPGDKARPTHSSSRPSTPSPRPLIPASSPHSNTGSSTPAAARSGSRPSTPTRRASAPSSPAPAAARSPSVGRSTAGSGRNHGPASRPSSPGARARPPSQTPDFPFEAPPNLMRAKAPERPASAGRLRPGPSSTARSNVNTEAMAPANSNRRQSVSPIVARGRLPENSPRLRMQSNGHVHEPIPPEAQKPVPRESSVPKGTKTAASTESTGFGRTISKKSLDMALRHMDIRQSMGGVRGASLFPQSIRSTSAKVMPARVSDTKVPVFRNGMDTDNNSCNGTIHTACNGATSENEDVDLKSLEREILVGRASEPDIYESSRYEAILLKEDARNMNWLHSIEDKFDQSPVFDLRLEPLPEPFVLI